MFDVCVHTVFLNKTQISERTCEKVVRGVECNLGNVSMGWEPCTLLPGAHTLFFKCSLEGPPKMSQAPGNSLTNSTLRAEMGVWEREVQWPPTHRFYQDRVQAFHLHPPASHRWS